MSEIMSTTQPTILCQSCLDRQLEPEEAIGLYKGLPICDKCLGFITDNFNSVGEQSTPENDGSLVARVNAAKIMLDSLEAIAENWPLTAEETLLCHEDFYNHRPPAIINLPLKDLEKIYSRRKGLLFAVRHKDERWATFISNEKQRAREEANLTGLAASKKEVSKRVSQSGESLKAKQKTASALGISLEAYLEIEKQAAIKKFEAIVGADKANPLPLESSSNGGAKENLRNIQEKKRTEEKLKINPFTGKPY